MTRYGQFCPVAKSAEIIGDPWSILIVRELLLGSSRFSELERGLSRISPTVLTTRLKQLEGRGVLIKRRLNGQRGHEYRLTAAGRELAAVVDSLAVWGMRWARDEMGPNDLDVSLLMFDIQRRINTAALPAGETVLCFLINDAKRQFRRWWLICQGAEVDLCYEDPGKDVDCYVTATAADLIGTWMGDVPLSKALRSELIQISGERQVCRAFPKWFPLSTAADIPRPTLAQRRVID